MGASSQDVPWFAADNDTQVAFRAHDASQIRTNFLRVQINGANDLNVRLLQHQAHNSGADGPNSVLDNADSMSGQEGLPPDPLVRKDLILHEGWRPFSDGKNPVSRFQVSKFRTAQ